MSSNRYHEDGFSTFDNPIVTSEVVELGNAGMDDLIAGRYDTGTVPDGWRPGDDPNQLIKIELPQIGSSKIRDVISHPAIGEHAAALTGASMIQVWWVQMLHKPPARPGLANVVGWHQDQSYWGCWEEGSELLTCWLALSDVTVESGPMKFIRGSNQWGIIEGGDFFGQDNVSIQSDLDVPAGATWDERPVILPAGGASFHDRLTVHGSELNRSRTPRRSLALHLRTDKAKPRTDGNLHLVQYLDDPALNPVLLEWVRDPRELSRNPL